MSDAEPQPDAPADGGAPADVEFVSELRGQALRFRTTWGLFSPRAIDSGTRLLLDFVEVQPDDDCLDLGCGYGPVGLTLARLAPGGRTMLVDKDFVAVEYAQRNAELNGIENVDVLLSNAYSHIPAERRFNLIAANIPARAGNEMLEMMVAGAQHRLAPGGRLYVVGLTGMRKFVRRLVEQHFGNYEKLKQGRDYTVASAVRE